MEFYVYELNKTIKAKQRPIIIITSNNEKELPDAFLRRCFFYYITFPDPATMSEIIRVHFPTLSDDLMDNAMKVFYNIREVKGLKKKPSTSELLDWIKLLKYGETKTEDLAKVDISTEAPPFAGALLKNEQDYTLMERLRRFGR
jgi:MoxR-like ATPase